MQKEDQELLSHMCAITISREYGSGGGEIARRLAQKLGWRLIDHEVLLGVAQELDVSLAEVEIFDEHVGNLMTRFLNSMQTVDPGSPSVLPQPQQMNAHDYREALHKVTQAAIAEGHVVIVGRGSQILLAKKRDTLHIRVVAPFELRVRYVMSREGLNPSQAKERIQFKDRGRARYLQAEHHIQPDNPHLYDLVINTSIIDLDGAVELICLALQQKARKLSIPQEALGPGAGLSTYPGQPHDFRPPAYTGPLVSEQKEA